MAGFGESSFGVSPFGLADAPGGAGGFGTGPFGTSPFGTGGGVTPVPAPVVEPQPKLHEWVAFSRTASYAPGVHLPTVSLSGVLAHMGVDKAVLTTTYTPERWDAIGAPNGLILYRDGVQLFTGRTQSRTKSLDRTTGQYNIQASFVGEQQSLATRPVFPDPADRADAQTVNDYWMPRDGAGNPLTVVASTAMWQLISDQAGPTCRFSRQVPGLVMGANPGVGASRQWSGLYNDAGPQGVLDKLAQFSASSGADLGIRFTSSAGSLTVDVVQPRELSSAAVFSVDVGNLVQFEYTESAPTKTHSLVLGAGSLHARVGYLSITTDPIALSWGIQAWSLVDRSDTSDPVQMAAAATDDLSQGVSMVNLQCTLTDSQAATWRTDYDLGDRVTVLVGASGQAKTTVTDVIRQIAFNVDSKGTETIHPAIGSYDAKAIIPTPTQQKLALVGAQTAGLISRK